MESSRTSPWPRGSSRTLLTVLDLDLGTQVLGPGTCVFDSVTASNDDDISALWQPLYESTGHILRWNLRNFAERLHSVQSFGFNDACPWLWPRGLKPLASHTCPWRTSPCPWRTIPCPWHLSLCPWLHHGHKATTRLQGNYKSTSKLQEKATRIKLQGNYEEVINYEEAIQVACNFVRGHCMTTM